MSVTVVVVEDARTCKLPSNLDQGTDLRLVLKLSSDKTCYIRGKTYHMRETRIVVPIS